MTTAQSPHPTLTSWFSDTEPTVRYGGKYALFFYHLFYDSSLSSCLICTQTGSHVLPSFLPLFLPWLPEAFLVSPCCSLSWVRFLLSSSFPPTCLFSVSLLLSFLTIRSQCGSVRSWRDLCPLTSARQCPVGVIMMDGVISRGAFCQQGCAHHAFSLL